jgi:hypothetical protein
MHKSSKLCLATSPQRIANNLRLPHITIHKSLHNIYCMAETNTTFTVKKMNSLCTSTLLLEVLFMVINATVNNISVISWLSVFYGGGNRSTQRKPLICRMSLTNFIT